MKKVLKKIRFWKGWELVLLLLCIAMAGMWAATSADKILGLERFIVLLKDKPLPAWVVPAVAWLLTTWGMATAVLLAIPKSRRWGLYSSGLLILFYFTYTVLAVTYVIKNLPCSCLGVKESYSYEDQLWFNTKALIVALCSIIIHQVLILNHKQAMKRM